MGEAKCGKNRGAGPLFACYKKYSMKEEVNFFRSVNLVKDGVDGRLFQYVTTDSVLVFLFFRRNRFSSLHLS